MTISCAFTTKSSLAHVDMVIPDIVLYFALQTLFSFAKYLKAKLNKSEHARFITGQWAKVKIASVQ